MDTRERYTELEEKLEKMGSTLEAYGHSSESDVIHRLQSEVCTCTCMTTITNSIGSL